MIDIEYFILPFFLIYYSYLIFLRMEIFCLLFIYFEKEFTIKR
jgi:hypothetical protein